MLRVMIVEDEPVIAMDLEDILQSAGHWVVGIASSMRDALDMAAHLPRIDVAIMDVNLADGASGVETARWLHVYHGINSLFVSLNITDDIRDRALRSGAIGFVDKPFRAEDIVSAIGRAERMRAYA